MTHGVLVMMIGVVLANLLLVAFPMLSQWLMGARIMDFSQSPIERWAMDRKPPIAAPPCEADGCTYSVVTADQFLWASDALQGLGRLELPMPQTHLAPEGGYLDELIDWVAGDPLVPAVLYPAVPDAKPSQDVDVLFREVDANGHRRVITATQAGLITHSAAPELESGRLVPWPEGEQKWRAIMGHDPTDRNWSRRDKERRFSAVVFQPIPSTLTVSLRSGAWGGQYRPQPGDGLALTFDPKNVMLSAASASAFGRRNAWLGVVRDVQTANGQLSITFDAATGIPNPLNEGWYSGAIKAVPSDGTAIWMWVWNPAQPLGEMGWNKAQEATQVEQSLQVLQTEFTWRLPNTALDAQCASPSGGSGRGSPSCVWIVMDGIAVPIQVSVLAETVDGVLVRERPVMGDLPLDGAHWSALPLKTQRALKARPANANHSGVALLAAPQQVLKVFNHTSERRAGQPVRVRNAT